MTAKTTAVDRILKRLKNNRVLALLIVGGVIIIGLGAFTSALTDIWSLIPQREPPTAPTIRLAQFSIDENAPYKIFRHESNQGSSDQGWSQRYLSANVPVAFEKTPGVQKKGALFFITLQNDGPTQAVLNRAVLQIHEIWPSLGVGESAVLEPLGACSIRISPTKGSYSSDLVAPIKIAGNDSASLTVQVLPSSLDTWTSEKIVEAEITVHWEGGSITMPRFAFDL